MYLFAVFAILILIFITNYNGAISKLSLALVYL